MRILGIHAQDFQGVGGALRGQEMAYALQCRGHEVIQGDLKQNIRNWFSQDQIDAVILTGTWHQLLTGNSHAMLIADACDEYGIPCIWWYGSNGAIWAQPDPSPEIRAASTKRILGLIMERPFIGVICPYSQGIYERYGIPREKLHLIPSVFDDRLFTPATDTDRHIGDRLRFKFHLPAAAFCVGCVGTTPNSKGGNYLIEALALIQRDVPDMHLVFLHTPIGNLSKNKAVSADKQTIGNSEQDCVRETIGLAGTFGLTDRVHFIGARFMRIGMPGFYRALNAYASPSCADNLPQPVVEAQLCGLPTLLWKGLWCDFIAGPECIQIPVGHFDVDDRGLQIPVADPATLADGLRALRDTTPRPLAAHAAMAARFGHQNASVMEEAIAEMRAGCHTRNQVRVGDQGEAMVAGYAAAAERIAVELGGPPGRKVLDVGANTGDGMQELARRWPESRIFGVEPVNWFSEVARGKGLAVESAPAERLPYNDDSFHLVFFRHSLEHVLDQAAAMAEALRILVLGGYCYIQAPIEPGGTANKRHVSPFLSAAEVRALGDGPEWTEVYWGPQATVAELILKKCGLRMDSSL